MSRRVVRTLYIAKNACAAKQPVCFAAQYICRHSHSSSSMSWGFSLAFTLPNAFTITPFSSMR